MNIFEIFIIILLSNGRHTNRSARRIDLYSVCKIQIAQSANDCCSMFMQSVIVNCKSTTSPNQHPECEQMPTQPWAMSMWKYEIIFMICICEREFVHKFQMKQITCSFLSKIFFSRILCLWKRSQKVTSSQNNKWLFHWMHLQINKLKSQHEPCLNYYCNYHYYTFRCVSLGLRLQSLGLRGAEHSLQQEKCSIPHQTIRNYYILLSKLFPPVIFGVIGFCVPCPPFTQTYLCLLLVDSRLFAVPMPFPNCFQSNNERVMKIVKKELFSF